MSEINPENVRAVFVRITGVEDDDKYNDLISSCTKKIQKLAYQRELDDNDAARCEHAAAADAVYIFTCEKNLHPSLIMTENGGMERKKPDDNAVRCAKNLRDSAFAAISDIINDEGFVFNAV